MEIMNHSGLEPYEAQSQIAEAASDEAARDAQKPVSVYDAADEPYRVKAQLREDYANTGEHERERKVRSPFGLTKASLRYSIKRTLAEFSRDNCTDLAAGLTYYAVLSMFPALIALVSLLSLVGQAQSVENAVVGMLEDVVDEDLLSIITNVLGAITAAPGAGIGLAIGILTAMWTASNYVNAFSRALNRIYEVSEGRSVLVLRPVIYAITVGLIMLVAAAGLMLVLSGPVAEMIGEAIGFEETAVTVWNWVSPVLLVLVAGGCIALLYYGTPNIRQPGVLWVSAGALVAIVVMVLSTVGVGIYVANFANYEATYGALAGVIILLFWIYIMNLVLLFGAEFDAELERARQLQAGIDAEQTVMLAPRSNAGSVKKAEKYQQLVDQAVALKQSEGRSSNPEDAWRM